MKEILVGKDISIYPNCWGKFCMHCSYLMWERGNTIDAIIREELVPFKALLLSRPDGGYRILFTEDENYTWFCLKFS